MKEHWLTRAFIKAAKSIDRSAIERFSCLALSAACKDKLPYDRVLFLSPQQMELRDFYLNSASLCHVPFRNPGLTNSIRVLLLLFMAAAWKDMPGAERFR